MSGIFDAAVVVIIGLSALACCFRGFIKTAFGFAATVAAFVIALFVSGTFCDAVYESYFKQSAHDIAYKYVSKIDAGELIENYLREKNIDSEIDKDELNRAIASNGEVSENVAKYMEKQGEDKDHIEGLIDKYLDSDRLPEDMSDEQSRELQNVKSILKENSVEIKEALKAIADEDKNKAADFFEEKILAPIGKKLVRGGLFLSVFLILKVVISIVILATGVLKRFELVRKTDMLLGLACGAVGGIVTVICIAYALNMFISLTGGGIAPVNKDMINDTVIFKLFYSIFSH